MNQADLAYSGILSSLLDRGTSVYTRNSQVRRIFPYQVTFTSFPILTTRKVAWRNALREWEWFMSGSNSISFLHPSVQSWWSPWVNTVGRILYNYSQQFRFWRGDFDQIWTLLKGVEEHPYSRRNVISTWDSKDMNAKDCKITNCHGSLIQCFVEPNEGEGNNLLHMVTYQRSVDVICGLPHNWVQYWAFLKWIATWAGYEEGSLTWIGGDVHLYNEHEGIARRILDTPTHPSPNLVHSPGGRKDWFKEEDFSLSGEYLFSFQDRAKMVV